MPASLLVNTGRDERFGSEVDGLVPLGLGKSLDLWRCPDCAALFEWRDLPQAYGSGNNDEEELVRLAPDVQALLERLLAGDIAWVDASALIRAGFAQVTFELFVTLLSRLPPDRFEFVLPDLVERLVVWDAAADDGATRAATLSGSPAILAAAAANALRDKNLSVFHLLSAFARDRPERARLVRGLLPAEPSALGNRGKALAASCDDELKRGSPS